MNKNRFFNLGRFAQVLKRDAAAGSRTVLLTLVTLGVALFFLSFFSGIKPAGVDIHTNMWAGFLLIGGFIATSMMFKEMHSKEKGHDWAMLPASSLEKVISRLLLSSLGWVVGFTAVYWATSSLGEGVCRLIFGHGNPIFNPFTLITVKVALHYCLLQSVFLLGAAYFRKAHFLKTVLVINVVIILMAALGLFFMKLFFWNVFTEEVFGGNSMIGWIDWNLVSDEAESYFLAFSRILKIVYFSVFAPILWVITYFRVTEKEVRNGV